MRKSYSRILAVAAAIISAGLVGACAAGPADKKVALADVSVGAVKDYAAGTTFKATVPVTFSILYSDHPNYPIKADWLLWQKMTELTNVTLDRTIAPPAPLTDTDREQATLLSTPLTDYVDQATLQFILGQRDLSQFDAFVTELQGKGMTRCTDMKNKAYTDFKQKK